MHGGNLRFILYTMGAAAQGADLHRINSGNAAQLVRP